MGIIRRMETHLANMIAAGEVVERPANVVKELLENAIDAHANVIAVELKGGGLDAIRVTDDGVGMDETDLALAFERHATSKIQTERDLFRIASLGFRGEALPSIAAVSTIEAQSCQEGQDGRLIRIVSGVVQQRGLAPSRKGTTVQVSKLFHNTPARLKYIKSAQLELATIADVVDKAALAHPNVAFSLTHEGKTLLRTSGKGDRLETIQIIYGNDVAKHAMLLDTQNRDYRVKGYLCSPMHTRSHRMAMTFIVNGRVIRSYKLAQALVAAYGQSIPKGRFPIAVLWIEADPSILDVNIHPTKQEIKFSEEDRLLELVQTEARKVLIKQPYVAIVASLSSPSTQIKIMEETPPFDAEAFVSVLSSNESTQAAIVSPPETRIEGIGLPAMSYLGQYAGTYLLFQNEEGLTLLDQHAAAERIRYERYKANMSRPSTEQNELLIPMTLSFSTDETLRLEQRIMELEAFGLKLRKESDHSFTAVSVPAWLSQDTLQEAVEELCRQAIEGEPLDSAKAIDQLAILLACKHSLKANRYVSAQEASALINDLNRCEQSYTCPHGRPIFVQIAHRDVERWFKRIV